MYEYKIILKIKDVDEEFIFYSDIDLKGHKLKDSMKIEIEYKITLKVDDVDEDFIFHSDHRDLDLKSDELKESMKILKRVKEKKDYSLGEDGLEYLKNMFGMK
jgi:hypothetical protein